MGIEPTSQAWEAGILPMNYTRVGWGYYNKALPKMQGGFCHVRAAPAHDNAKCKMHNAK